MNGSGGVAVTGCNLPRPPGSWALEAPRHRLISPAIDRLSRQFELQGAVADTELLHEHIARCALDLTPLIGVNVED